MVKDWKHHHVAARYAPGLEELPLVELLRGTESFVVRYANDGVLRSGIAHLLIGIRVLLVADNGARLDAGSIDSELLDWAEAIGFDMDTEQFKDGEEL